MTKKALILVLAIVSSILMFPVVAQADNVDWTVTYPGGSVHNSVPAQVTAYSVPATLTGTIDNPQGRTIIKVVWEEDNSVGPYHIWKDTDPGRPANWSATWSYAREGTYYPALDVQYSDQSWDKYGFRINVVDPANHNSQVSYAGPDTLDQSNNAKNVFRVDYTGTFLEVRIERNDGSSPASLAPFSTWTDAAGHHANFRVTHAPVGNDRIIMHSGDAFNAKDVTVVGQPVQKADFTSVKVDMFGQKGTGQRTGKCGVIGRIQATGNVPATATLKVHLSGKLPQGKWTKLGHASLTKSYPVSSWQLRTGMWFSKNGTLASYLKNKQSQFHYVIDQAMIKKQNGTTVLNLKAKTYPMSRTNLAACQPARTVFTAASL